MLSSNDLLLQGDSVVDAIVALELNDAVSTRKTMIPNDVLLNYLGTKGRKKRPSFHHQKLPVK